MVHKHEDRTVDTQSPLTASHPIPVVRLIVPCPEGRVLILQRDSDDYLGGKWCLPGGKIEYGETIAQAVKRELYEETALICTSMTFLFYQDSLPMEPDGMHCINLYLECTVQGPIELNEESRKFAWIGSGDMPQYDITFRNDTALLTYWQNRALQPGP